MPKDNIQTARIDLTIPASPEWFGTVRNLLVGISRACGFSDRDAGGVALAVDEAMSNVFRHGYSSSAGVIELRLEAFSATQTAPCRISICIEDRGKQVDVDTICSRNLDDVKPGGLGVHLIQSIMDEATWNHREGGGMCLVLEKQGNRLNTDSPKPSTQTNGPCKE